MARAPLTSLQNTPVPAEARSPAAGTTQCPAPIRYPGPRFPKDSLEARWRRSALLWSAAEQRIRCPGEWP